MVNGTWTYNHILSLWRQPESPFAFSLSSRDLDRVSAVRYLRAPQAGSRLRAPALRAVDRAVPSGEGPREAAVHSAEVDRCR